MVTLQWASVVDRTAESPCEARPSAPSTHYLLSSPPFSLEKKVLLLSAASAVQVEEREIHTQGSRGDSAVRSTTEAHCIVTTHYFLPSPPFSLP